MGREVHNLQVEEETGHCDSSQARGTGTRVQFSGELSWEQEGPSVEGLGVRTESGPDRRSSGRAALWEAVAAGEPGEARAPGGRLKG